MTDGGFWKPASSSVAWGGDDDDARNQDDVAQSAAVVRSWAPLAQQRILLPIYKHKKQILYAVENFSVTIICGETGCGKSTQIPQYLVEAGGWGENDFQVVCTQPRRIAAVSLAHRVAEEVGTFVGGRVGYSVRFEDQSSASTQIKYVTDGLLLREATLGDPLLSRYSVVMVDEAHERSLNSDALLGLLKKIRRKRKGLRLIICSATIDAQQFLDFFVSNTSEKDKDSALEKGTIISVDGRQHPVDVLYRDRAASDYIRAMVETAKLIHQHESDGDILCFLPSGEDIDSAIHLSEEVFQEIPTVDFLPLYGTLPLHMQTRVFQPSSDTARSKRDGGRHQRRRIIFASNVAETSLTVPGIGFVIDSGLVKLPYFDPRTGLERLIVGPISRASARQRAGRAGRISAGKCYRLYTEQFCLEKLPPFTPPEIIRTNLSSFILTLKALGVENILAFDLLDIPSVDSLSHGLELLYALGAMDDKTHLTQLGLDMSAFPTEPSIARMLLESLSTGCAWQVLSVAAALQVRALFQKPRGQQRQRMRHQQQQLDYDSAMRAVADPSGDHVTFANLLAQADDCMISDDEWKERFVNAVALKRALEVRNQLGRFLRQFGRLSSIGILSNVTGDDDGHRSKAIRRCVTAGFFFNVAKLSNDGRYYTMRKKILVTPSSSSVYSTHASVSSEYIVFGETMDGPRGGIELRNVSAIEARWLRELAPHYWD